MPGRAIFAWSPALLVGGTMLYFRAFLQGLAPMPAADTVVRAAIEAEAAERGWPALHEELQRVDPEAAQRIHPNHSQRLSRALEVYRATGVPISEWQLRQQDDGAASRYRLCQLAICPRDRSVLHQRIALRFEQMMAAGALEEVRQLVEIGLDPQLPLMGALGVRPLAAHLAGEVSREAAIGAAQTDSRQYAKRQVTWARSNMMTWKWIEEKEMECCWSNFVSFIDH
jgi:tRNA dimethylallyltransferase